MKKGFTLVEVLAVIVILGLLIAIVSPVVNNLLGDSEDTLYQEQVDNIVKASKKYMVENSDLLPEGSDSIAIYISDLIDKGIIDSDNVIDPKTKEEMNGCVVVNYNESFNQYEYNYKEDCSITITFDPEGGIVDTESKSVMIGKPYGELPTPTRTGYNFLGWCGKNMFSKDNTTTNNTDSYSYVTFQDDLIVFDSSNVEGNRASYIFISGVLDNTNVADGIRSDNTVGYKSYVLNLNGTYKYNSIRLKLNTNKKDAVMKIKNILDQNKKYAISYSIDEFDSGHVRAVISNLQLEEGEVATSYEPYETFTSDTIVKKGNNYTMHAVWEVAS